MGSSTGKIVGNALGGLGGFLIGSAVDDAHSAKHAQRKAQHAQGRLLEEQRKILKEQQAADLAKRREQIDQQREQLASGGYSTNQTSETGLVGGIRGRLG